MNFKFQAFFAFALGVSAKYAHMKFGVHTFRMNSNSTSHGRNSTAQNGTKIPESVRYYEHTSVWVVTFIGFSVVAILVSFILALLAVLNNPKLRRFLYIWVGWTCLCIGLELMNLIATIAFISTHMVTVRILIYVLGILYELLCLWIVASYYKLLANDVNTPGEGYNAFFGTADPDFPDGNENQKPLHTI
eukprot:Seg235.7 transcript_id=Seg235.7/GoldUCD/mRNA.D3Y31 product="hypothetical protein" protein_id=Seg235.7/GoldUCD/D3Y31